MNSSEDKDKVYYEIGRQIKKIRKEQKMTMNELSQKVDLSQSAISMIENGVRCPPLSTLKKFSDVLGYDFTRLLATQTESTDTTDYTDIEVKAVDSQLTLSVKEFRSDISDSDINTAIRQTFVTYIQKLLTKEEVLREIEDALKRTIKNKLDEKQSELNKLYNKIDD